MGEKEQARKLTEGPVRKGGVNEDPKTPKPDITPAGQGSKKTILESHQEPLKRPLREGASKKQLLNKKISHLQSKYDSLVAHFIDQYGWQFQDRALYKRAHAYAKRMLEVVRNE